MSAEQRKTIEEPSRRVPVTDEVDVLVAGGGPAGIAAALAAAREGARALLVERYGYLGGMVTGCHVVWILGCGDGQVPVARGVTLEIRERFERLGAVTGLGRAGDYRVDPEVFKWQAAEMLSEAGAGVLLHAFAAAPILENGRVAGAFIESKQGRQAIRAKVTIDATADADLAWRAGCPCDDQTHDVTLRVLLEGIDRDRVAAFRQAEPEKYAVIVAEAMKRNGGCLLERARHLKGIDVADPVALTRAEINLRRDAFDALAYLRGALPGYEKARVAHTLPQIGVRLGRRVRGVHRLTGAELRESRHFDDSIARLGVYHLNYKMYVIAGLDYDVPYRCMVPETLDGLLIAGRCVSCDYEAGDTMRLIVPCFATGQGAGAAAAIAARRGVEPRDVPIAALRAALLKQDVYLGGANAPADRRSASEPSAVESASFAAVEHE